MNSNMVSSGRSPYQPRCGECRHFTPDCYYTFYGWCTHPQNRVVPEQERAAFPAGFSPSVCVDGGCDLHQAKE